MSVCRVVAALVTPIVVVVVAVACGGGGTRGTDEPADLVPAEALDAAPEVAACSREPDDCPAGSFCNFGACRPTQVALPADAAPHQENVEWWYYTGHLEAGARRFGFEVALFQQDMAYFGGAHGLLGYMCHVAVLDEGAAAHDETNVATITADTWTASPVVLQVQNCRLELDGHGRDRVQGLVGGTFKDPAGATWALDLSLEPRKPVTYHGRDGVVEMGNLGDTSYYYSYTRLEATRALVQAHLERAGQPGLLKETGK